MRFVKAIDRLPEVLLDTSQQFFCRNVKDGSKRVFWFGKSSGSMLVRNPYEWEWLDESKDEKIFNETKKAEET